MQKMKCRFVLVLLLSSASFIASYAQTVVKGVIKDAVTQQPLQFVSVYFKGGKGVTSGTDGSYTLTTVNNKLTTVLFSYVGYKTITKRIFPGRQQEIYIQLELADTHNNVYVKTNKRSKYTNKNNPAVELIRKVIDNKDKNRISAYDYVSYDQYEKMELMLTKTPEKLLNNKLLRNWKFIFENNDTTKIQGKAMLPVYLDETFSQQYYRKYPEKKKTYILGDKKVNFGEYFDIGGISSYLDRLYEDVDVYQNNISLLSNTLLSPIADMAPSFYRFYIADTTVIDNVILHAA